MEYEAVIAGLKLALQIPITSLAMYYDLELIVKQLGREYMRKTKLVPYHKSAEQLLEQFEEVKVLYVRRALNAKADALVAFVASLPSGWGKSAI